MLEVKIDDKNKTLLSGIHKEHKNVQSVWNEIYPGIDVKSAILLENQKRLIREISQSSDAGPLDVLYQIMTPIIRRTLPCGLAKSIVSVQPIQYPTAMVFYYDPKVETTKGSSVYSSLIEARSGHSNYDISLGEATYVNGAITALTAAQCLSGSPFYVSYSGGVNSLASLELILSGDQTGISGKNGIITTSAGSLLSPSEWDDNLGSTNYYVVHSASTSGWTQIQITSHTPTITAYSLRSGPTGTGALSARTVWLCGSTNGTSWDQLDYRATPNWTASTTSIFNLSAVSTGNTYFRVGISGATTGVIVNELQLLGYGSFPYVISPQTWSNNLFANNLINVIAASGIISAETGAFAYTRYKTYASNEAVTGIQQVQLNITGDTVSCVSRKLKANWTEELNQNAESMLDLNMGEELADLMSKEISLEIDREIISDLINIAPYQTSWHYSPRSAVTRVDGTVIPAGIASARTIQMEWNQTLLTEIGKVSAAIGRANYSHEANWIVCSAKVCSVIQDNIDYVPADNYSGYVIQYVGRLNCKYNVYVDPMLPDDICLIGYVGKNDYDCGYIYAPYIVLQPSEKVLDPDTIFDWKQGLMNRVAKKVINNKKYGLIRCTFPADYAVING